MIEKHIFQNFVFPCYLLDEQGDIILRHSGSLFLADIRTQKEDIIDIYRASQTGWSVCPNGYAFYKVKIPTPNRLTLVVYSLKVKGLSSTSGKSASLSIKTGKDELERYIKNTIRVINDCDAYFKAFIASNIHEIRNVNANIYNTTLLLRQDIERRGVDLFKDLPVLRNIESLSEVLKVRSDYIDVVSRSVIADLPGGKISVYRKFDKIAKSLMPSSRSSKLQIKLDGDSHSLVSGLKLFEVIPYLLLHNAIKYAPESSTIDINIQETQEEVVVVLQSLGPQLSIEEKDKIFNFGFRGKYARDRNSEGSGIGLFFFKQLMSLHEGSSIEFFQDPQHYKIERNIPYCKTSFILKFKILEKISSGPSCKLKLDA